MWIFPSIKLSWHSCSMWNKLGWLNWFWQFLNEGLSFFDPKWFYYSYAWSYSLCERRTSFCRGIISRKLQILMYSYLSGLQFDWLYFCLSYSPLLYPSPSSSLCMAFDSVSSNLEGLLLIIQSANVFVFGDFNVHPKDWLTYSGRTDILVNSVITFLSQTTLLRWLTFLLGSLTGTLTVLLMWILWVVSGWNWCIYPPL